MKTTGKKSHSPLRHSKPFFGAHQKEDFFSESISENQPFFNPTFVQPKLKVEKPEGEHLQLAGNPGAGSHLSVREYLEKVISGWEEIGRNILYIKIDAGWLNKYLASWMRMATNGLRLIDNQLLGDGQLKERWKRVYTNNVNTLITKAGRDMGQTQQQLYARYNRQIAWWARSSLQTRENIVFILGAGGKFYRSAIQYYRFTGERTVPNLRTLEAVRDYLENNPPGNGLPWGEVSIVAHANLWGELPGVPVETGDQDSVSPRTLRNAIQNHNFNALDDDVVDSATKIIIRGCAIGRNQAMLELLRTAFGGNDAEKPHIYAPIHLQEYQYSIRSVRRGRRRRRVRRLQAQQFFSEFWFVGIPFNPWRILKKGKVRLNNREYGRQSRRFSAKYPNVPLNWRKMLRRPHSRKALGKRLQYKFRNLLAPANNSQLTKLVRKTHKHLGSKRWKAIRETARQVSPTGLVTITFSYRKKGRTLTGGTTPQLRPRLAGQGAMRACAARLPKLRALFPIEENLQLNQDDFLWRYSSNGTLAGGRVLVRVERELREPIPGRRRRTRRVRPDISDPAQFGRAAPADY